MDLAENTEASENPLEPDLVANPVQPKGVTQDQAQRLRMLYAARPDRWIKAVTGEDVWWKQREIMRSVAVNPRTAVASCNSSGKSFIASRLIPWFMNIYSPSLVITTAPTNRQVEEVIWREVMRCYQKAARRGIILGDPPLTREWKLDYERYAIGFAPREYDPSAFQGFHARNMLVIVDEAAGVDDDILAGVDSVVRGSNYRILYIGNPTTITGRFYRAFKTPGWWTTHISAFQSPNVVEGREVVPGVITQRDIDDVESEYGRDSWHWRVYITGRFPDQEEGTLIAIDWINKAHARDESEIAKSSEVEIGADIARYGSDATVFVAQRGFHAFYKERHRGLDTMQAVGELLRFCDRTDGRTVRIDTVGLGAGVLDRFREVKPKHVRVVEMIGSAKAQNPLKYANAVTEWWDHLANLLKGNMASGSIFGDKHVVGDLASRKAKMLSNGLMMLENKGETKKRIHRSPDDGDACVMAFAGKILRTSRRHGRGAPLRRREDNPVFSRIEG